MTTIYFFYTIKPCQTLRVSDGEEEGVAFGTLVIVSSPAFYLSPLDDQPTNRRSVWELVPCSSSQASLLARRRETCAVEPVPSPSLSRGRPYLSLVSLLLLPPEGLLISPAEWLCCVSSVSSSDKEWHLEVVWTAGRERETKTEQNVWCFFLVVVLFLAKVRLVFLPLCAWIQTDALWPPPPPPPPSFTSANGQQRYQELPVLAFLSLLLSLSLCGTAEGVMWCRTCQCNKRRESQSFPPVWSRASGGFEAAASHLGGGWRLAPASGLETKSGINAKWNDCVYFFRSFLIA